MDPPAGWLHGFSPLVGFSELIDHFCNQIVDQRGVMIVPASMFDVSGGHFRVGLGRVNFTEALDVLADFLERRKPETE